LTVAIRLLMKQGGIKMEAQDRMLLRVTGLLAMLSPVVLIVSLVVRPRTPSPQDVQANLEAFAGNAARFHIIGLAVPVGMLLMLGGFVGLYHALRESTAATWARLAFVAAVAAAPITLLGPMVDGIVMPAVAQVYTQAPAGEATAALNLGKAFFVLNEALLGPMILMLSVIFLLYGLALTRDGIYPRWLGWLGVVEGILGLFVVVALIITGPLPPVQLFVPVVLFRLLMMAWVFLAGLFTWRGADAVAEGAQRYA
jgi:hypothetical protein